MRHTQTLRDRGPTVATEPKAVAVALRGVTKAYPGALACEKVTAEFYWGEIHALLGENGAGKSTIVKILGGMLSPDGGHVETDGQEVSLPSPRFARTRGIGIVHQTGCLIDSLTVDQNLRLGERLRVPGARLLPARRRSRPQENWLCSLRELWRGRSSSNVDCLDEQPPEKRRLTSDGSVSGDVVSRVRPVFFDGTGVPSNVLVCDLDPRQRRLVEIGRLLTSEVRILVLDEPTSALTPQESEALFEQLRCLANRGYAIVVVSHKLPEITKHADRFTVIRKGRVVGTLERAEANSKHLAEMILGRQDSTLPENADLAQSAWSSTGVTTRLARRRHWQATACEPRPLLRLKGVSTARESFHESPLCAVDIEFRRDEIVGVAGRAGSGAMVLLRLIYGEPFRLEQGCFEWVGVAPTNGHTVGFMPAEAHVAGLVGDLTIAENLVLRRRELLGHAWWRSRREFASAFVAKLIEDYDIRPKNPREKVKNLSGGNMRKVLLAREMEYATDMLLAVNPTAGLDIASTEFVRQRILQQPESRCTLVHSQDVDELCALCDRVLVLSRGSIVGELSGEQLTREAIGLAISEASHSDEPSQVVKGGG
jgi:ABC-type uncharacterized transport system ATPase subunit